MLGLVSCVADMWVSCLGWLCYFFGFLLCSGKKHGLCSKYTSFTLSIRTSLG